MGRGPIMENFHSLHPAGSEQARTYTCHKEFEFQKDKCGNGDGDLHRQPRADSAIVIGYPPPRRGMGYWKMNVFHLEETVFKEKLRQQWAR
jgi:hypothetical protein